MGALGVPHGDEIIPVINEWLAKASLHKIPGRAACMSDAAPKKNPETFGCKSTGHGWGNYKLRITPDENSFKMQVLEEFNRRKS